MKKLLLAAALLAIGSQVNAQQLSQGSEVLTIQNGGARKFTTHTVNNAAFRGTGTTSPVDLLSDSMATGTSRISFYDRVSPLDSGLTYGTNKFGDKGFASEYNLTIDGVTPADTTISVVGVISKWGGVISATSAKSVTFGVWSRGVDKTLVAGHTKFYVYGKPSTLLGSQAAAATTLKTDGNFTVTAFGTAVNNLNASVYVGYTMNYTWANLAADTFCLRSTGTTATLSNIYTIASNNDSLLTSNNLVQNSAGTWLSPFDGGAAGGDMIIAPIITITCPTCVSTAINGVTRNNLTFFGSYPNPATNSTNVRFSLKNKADVIIEVVDATGKSISKINNAGLTIGDHTINIPTADFAAGNYIYMVRTSEGDAIASKFTVIK